MSIYLEQRKYQKRNGEVGHSVKMYDDYGSATIDIEEISFFDDDLDLLKYVIKEEWEHFKDMLEHIKEHECGINIDGTYYDFDEIKECFE